MIRLHAIVEGPTEKAFVDRVLGPFLASYDVFADARCVLTGRDSRTGRPFRGGMTNYLKIKTDIETWMKEDRSADCRFTTMFDLYGLPTDFPGYDLAVGRTPYAKIEFLEVAFGRDFQEEGRNRFLPYLQLHEFEALVLAEPEALAQEYLEYRKPIKNIVAMVGDQNPELIDDGYETAPSRRILKEIPAYDKVTSGVQIVSAIGLEKLRRRCLHFSQWISRLEGLNE